MTASDFFSGKTSAPVYMDLESKQTTDAPSPPPSQPASTPAAAASEPPKSSFPPTPVGAAEAPPVATLAGSSSPQDLARNVVGSASTNDAAELSPPATTRRSTADSAVADAPAPSASSPSGARSPSGVSSPAPAAATTASSSSANGANDGEVEQLRQKVSSLESKLAERDSLIRTLELKVRLQKVVTIECRTSWLNERSAGREIGWHPQERPRSLRLHLNMTIKACRREHPSQTFENVCISTKPRLTSTLILVPLLLLRPSGLEPPRTSLRPYSALAQEFGSDLACKSRSSASLVGASRSARLC